MPPATTGNSLSSGLCSHCITDRNLFDKSIAGRTHGSGHGRGLDETQLVMSDIARMHNNSSRQRAKEASRQARQTSSPLCTRPFGHSVVRCRLSVASASAQPTWRPARVSCTRTYRANTTLYHSPFPLLLCPLFLLLSPSPPSLCVSRSRFSQIGELECLEFSLFPSGRRHRAPFGHQAMGPHIHVCRRRRRRRRRCIFHPDYLSAYMRTGNSSLGKPRCSSVLTRRRPACSKRARNLSSTLLCISICTCRCHAWKQTAQLRGPLG
ncbi:hypothetical protein LY78DRAFT_89014 [Colletotrichum sublineola]|nr:hypothetical protein LY78DRAFT_89014 [Colletotrichum sublineola]